MTLVYEDLKEYSYALGDGTLNAGVPDGLAAEPLVPARLEASARLMPRLYELAPATPRARERALAAANTQYLDGDPMWLCGLLRTDAETTEAQLAAHLKRRLIVRLPAPGACFFRFFDPRVLVQLAWLLSPRQLAWLLGPVSAWKYCVEGEWAVLTRPDTAFMRSPEFTDEQAFALERMQVANEVLSRLSPPSIAARQAQGREVLRHIAKARDLGLSRPGDQQAYAMHGMTVHPEFHRHPLIIERLQSLPADADYPYQAATADLAPGDYERIRSDLSDPHRTTA